MNLPNELINLILDYLDQYTKYKLYKSTNIPYVSHITISNCCSDDTIRHMSSSDEINIQNMIIKKLVIKSKITKYPFGIQKVCVTSKFNYEENLGSINHHGIIKKLTLNGFDCFLNNENLQNFLYPFEQIKIKILNSRLYLIENCYLPNAKKLIICRTSPQQDRSKLVLSKCMPNLKQVTFKCNLPVSFEGLTTFKLNIPRLDLNFDSTIDVCSLKTADIIVFDSNFPTNLIALSVSNPPVILPNTLIRLEIINIDNHQKYDLTEHNLVYLKIPEILYLTNGDKLFNPSLKKLYLTDVSVLTTVPPIDHVVLEIKDGYENWLANVSNCKLLKLTFYKSIMKIINFYGSSDNLIFPLTITEIELKGNFQKITLPSTLKKLSLKGEIWCDIDLPKFIEILILDCYDYIFDHLPKHLLYYKGPDNGIKARYNYHSFDR